MNDRNAISYLLSEFSKLIDEKLKKYNADKTFKATVWKINSNGTYSINYKKNIYDIPNASGISLNVGQTVWVKIPSGIVKNMYIEGVQNWEILSSNTKNDHTHTNKSLLDSITSNLLNTWNTVVNKVDKIEGKGLSTNDLTNELKEKYDQAEKNIQSDWNEKNSQSSAYIKNKPTTFPASDVYDWAKEKNKPTYSYNEVNADKSGSAHLALTEAKQYTDDKIIEKVDKEEGKGLSENNFTLIHKTKLECLNVAYGICETVSTVVNKIVTVDDDTNWVLDIGSKIVVKFINTNSVANPTLNVNNTGDKYIKFRNVNISAGYLAANRIYEFIYDGLCYQLIGDLNIDTYDRVRFKGAVKCGDTPIAASNLIVGINGLYQQLNLGKPFDITHPILLASSSIFADKTGTNNYMIIPFKITTTQSINFTTHQPVYIKGKLSGTIFSPIGNDSLTQVIPTNSDGYQYIYIGVAYSTTAMYLLAEHPIYEYKNGHFSLYTNSKHSNDEIVSETIPNEQAIGEYWLLDY